MRWSSRRHPQPDRQTYAELTENTGRGGKPQRPAPPHRRAQQRRASGPPVGADTLGYKSEPTLKGKGRSVALRRRRIARDDNWWGLDGWGTRKSFAEKLGEILRPRGRTQDDTRSDIRSDYLKSCRAAFLKAAATGAKRRAEVVDSAGLYEGTVAAQNVPHVILSDSTGRSDFLSVRRTCSARIVGCNSFLCSRFAPAAV